MANSTDPRGEANPNAYMHGAGAYAKVPTSLRFPLDTENASTFIKFTSVKHSKILSGVTAKGHAEINAVAAATGSHIQASPHERSTKYDAGASVSKAVSTVSGAILGKMGEWGGAALSWATPDDFEDAYWASYNNIDSPDRLATTLGNTIEIFMPQSIQINDSATYDNAALGSAGRRIGAIAADGKLPGVSEALAMAGSAVGNFAQLIKGADPSAMSKSQLASVANKIPGGSEYRAAASHGFGVTLDPVNITTFTGVPIRQFSFTYKFIPNNEQEAAQIGKIIKSFRTELYPEKSGWALVYPNAFTIEQVHIPSNGSQRAIVLNKFLKSFLVSVSTTYNPTSMAMMADGSWSEVDLTLTFQEERSMHKNDVMNEGR
jgi:hypothetical protein